MLAIVCILKSFMIAHCIQFVGGSILGIPTVFDKGFLIINLKLALLLVWMNFRVQRAIFEMSLSKDIISDCILTMIVIFTFFYKYISSVLIIMGLILIIIEFRFRCETRFYQVIFSYLFILRTHWVLII